MTVVLKKPQKLDYISLKLYRPIALPNTILKALATIVARRMSNKAEERRLFLETRIGGRPKRSTLITLQLITEQFKTV